MWQSYVIEQLNIPSKDNYYQMQIASEIRKGNSKKPNSVKLAHFKVKFSSESDEVSEEERRKRIEDTKAIVMGFMTAPITVIKNGVVVDTIIPPLVKRQQILDDVNKKRALALAARKQIDERTRRTTSQTVRRRK